MAGDMQIDWQQTIEEILSNKVSCLSCGSLVAEVLVGYLRSADAARYAPLCKGCNPREDCDARKLVFLCAGCARQMGLRARQVSQETMMVMLLNDCRKDLEECLDYLAEYWQEDLNVPAEDTEVRLEEFDREAFDEEDEARRRLEEEYNRYHRWFRDHALRIPDPSWRAEYVEELIALGYTTLLGD